MEAWEEGEVPEMKKKSSGSVYQAGVKSQGKSGHAWGPGASMCRRELGCRMDGGMRFTHRLMEGRGKQEMRWMEIACKIFDCRDI